MSMDILQKASASRGFDSPVSTREGDHLNRWPLAREVFGIATTGPKNWSVRIGIYGEWGTGKTSVLKFIDTLAVKEGHILIWFNPWEHNSKAVLWEAFVLSVFKHIEAGIGGLTEAGDARRKAFLARVNEGASKVLGALAGDTGNAIATGLSLVKERFSFSSDDLAGLASVLGDRRVIILIDDLDRTAPELVPEILFALKELMDIPGFSFVCAFDPMVVGEVLGRYHPGFGDGLRFLDKIIDYPRWLSPASLEGLASLAVAEAERSCSYVPPTAIRDSLALLPRNPRAVRQFMRLLTLLKPQISRHYDHELNWPVILTANILKIRYPRIAHELLNAPSFWSSIQMANIRSRDHDEKGSLDAAVAEHIGNTYAHLGLSSGEAENLERNRIKSLLLAICSQVKLIGGLDEQGVAYQVNIAEVPTAVTWKEYDSFMAQWRPRQVTNTAMTWIAEHAEGVERNDLEVYRELLNAAIRRYAHALQQADNVFSEAERPAVVDECTSLLELLKVLVLDLGDLDQANKRVGTTELNLLVEQWASIAAANLPVHRDFWRRNEALIHTLFEKWVPDVMPLVSVLSPYSRINLRNFEGDAALNLHTSLCSIVLPKFARQIIAALREMGFVDRMMQSDRGTPEACFLIWDVKGALWGPLRAEVVGVLAEASSARAIQGNAFGLLRWFVLKEEGYGPGDLRAMRALFSDQEVVSAVWNAATATPLAPRGVYDLMNLPRKLQELGTRCSLPAWWQPIASAFLVPKTPEVPTDQSKAEGASEEVQ